MGNRALEDYLNSIDFTLITDSDILSNIYKEIGDSGNELAVNQYTNTSLEKLVNVSNPAELIKFLKTLDEKIVYRKLGSRIIESIFKRLFECMFLNGEYFPFKDAVEYIIPEKCVNCRSATFALRQVIMLLSARRIEKLEVEKYKIIDIPGEYSNTEYAKKKLAEYREKLEKCIFKLEEPDAFATFSLFIQCTKSQSLIKMVVEEYCDFDNIKINGFSYEAIASIANRSNLEIIFNKIKDRFLDLCKEDSASYFMKMFVKRYKNPAAIYKMIDLDEFEPDSNIILGLAESLQERREIVLVKELIERFYKVKAEIFEEFLLKRYETIDTKYVDLITNFMSMPQSHNFNVNRDFIKFFNKEWLKSKAGKRLVAGYMFGSADSREKIEFFNKNIDLFWGCTKWKEPKTFVKGLTEYTTGHSRKKAYEIKELVNKAN